jgi:hypothetical protein
MYEKWSTIPIELPQVEAKNLIYVYPKYKNEIPDGVVGCGGRITYDYRERQRNKNLSKRLRSGTARISN